MSESSPEQQQQQDIVEKKDIVVSNHGTPTNHGTPKNNGTPTSTVSKAKTKLMSRYCVSTDDDPLVLLNIGGTQMTTKQSTLMRVPNTVLALALVSPWSEQITRDDDGRIFFDLDPKLFQYLLNQIRDWSPTRKVFDLPKDSYERECFRSLCVQLNFDLSLIDGIYRQEKFSKVFGHVLIDERGIMARHAASYRFAECRGMNVYSSGINRIALTLKHKAMDKYSTFIGIIWAGTPMQEKSFESPTAYGWTGQKQVVLKGLPASIQGYGGYDSDMCTNDTVDITLNCQLGLISLYNHRTRKYYEIEVDLKAGCPLPWQLHINLYGPEDGVMLNTHLKE